MKAKLPLPRDKKLEVVFRVEPGCLGADGKEYVEQFCRYAQEEVEPIDSDFVHWVILSRHDKSLPEMEYQIAEKKLTHDKAARYLELFGKSLDEFEGHFHAKLVTLIEQFLVR